MMADVRGQAGVSSRDQIQRLSLSGCPREGGAHQVPQRHVFPRITQRALHGPDLPLHS